MTSSHAKVQGHRSIGSEDRVETKERTDGRRDGRRRLHYFAALMRSVEIALQMHRCLLVAACDGDGVADNDDVV